MSMLINLLPDLRQAKLRERRRRQLAIGISVVVWSLCGGIVVVLVLSSAGQKLAINRLSSDITANEQSITAVPNIVEALTAQQHLDSLKTLYSKRVYLTKFFTAYSQADPKDISIASLNIDSQNIMTVSGAGASFASVAKLAKALEALNVTVGTGSASGNSPYFSNISITNAAAVNGRGVNFSLTATVESGALSNGK